MHFSLLVCDVWGYWRDYNSHSVTEYFQTDLSHKIGNYKGDPLLATEIPAVRSCCVKVCFRKQCATHLPLQIESEKLNNSWSTPILQSGITKRCPVITNCEVLWKIDRISKINRKSWSFAFPAAWPKKRFWCCSFWSFCLCFVPLIKLETTQSWQKYTSRTEISS